MSTPTRHDDLDTLRGKRIRVPEVFRHGAWLTVPVGQRSGADIGPSSTQLLLWLPVTAAEAGSSAGRDNAPSPTWAEVEAAVGAARGPTSRSAPAAAMDALMSEREGLDVSIEAAQWIIRGREYPSDAFGNIFWKHGWALGTARGLLVSLMNG
ncbi:hypothetical protein [Haliangium sp.]|uniref:hypothetical protein n=1 Tax=Haliangium sp. TaxID=2663208 RepID=UPI003D143516